MDFIDVSLNQRQLKKIFNHETIQLKPEQLRGGPHRLYVKPRKLNRLQKAITNHVGVRLLLDSEEAGLSAGGAGIRDDLKKFHRAIKPALRGAVRTLARTGANYFAPGLGEVADPLVQKIGDITGAYGLRDDFRRFHRAMKPAIRQSLKGVARAAGDHVVPGLGRYADPVVDRIGDVTGAFGVKRGRGRPRKHPIAVGIKRPRGRPRKNVVNGGSFLPAGY